MLAISQRLLDGAFAADAAVATPPAFAHTGCADTTHTISWGEGVGSGVVVIEAADDDAYAGTWKTLETVTFAGTAPNVDVVHVVGAYPVLRHRVSTVLSDGSVTSKIVGSMP